MFRLPRVVSDKRTVERHYGMGFNVLIAGLAASHAEIQQSVACAPHEVQKTRSRQSTLCWQRGQTEISGLMSLVENHVENGLIIAFHGQSEKNILQVLPPPFGTHAPDRRSIPVRQAADVPRLEVASTSEKSFDE